MRWLTRLEYLALMTASGLLMLLHAGDVHWGRAVIAFAAIDLIQSTRDIPALKGDRFRISTATRDG